MTNKPNALKESLREQTIIIEDCTAELKALIRKRVYDGTPFNRFVGQADRLIDKMLAEVKDEEMRESSTVTLRGFARREFNRMRATLITTIGFSFLALKSVLALWNAKDVATKERAYRDLQAVESRFAYVPQAFEGGVGNTRLWAQPLNEYVKDYMSAVREASGMLAKDTAKDVDGLSLRLKSELYVRHKWQEDDLQKLRESGAKLVWISAHTNCSERCEPYQGRLYSLDGTSGRTEDGHDYVPLEEATERFQITKSGKMWKNGTLTGFGCRHYTIPYKPKGETPIDFDDKEVEEARAIEQEQRRLERKIYHEREHYYAFKGVDNVKAEYWRKRASVSRQEYIDFCRANQVAWYPDRIQVEPTNK